MQDAILEILGESVGRADSSAEIYHENSKIRRFPGGGGLPAEALMALGHGFKDYRHSTVMPLSPPEAPSSRSVLEAIRARRSIREFASNPLSADMISTLMFAAYGQLSPTGLHRTVPSAGGLYPLELYLACLSPGDIPPGVYHYDARNHALQRLPSFGDPQSIRDTIFVPEAARTAPAFFVITALFGRSRIKYGERAYRFALLEAGHIAQNVALICADQGLAFCPFGGFVDEEVHALLGLDGVDEAALYLGAIGRVSNPSPGTEPASGSDVESVNVQ